ncbi:hypothetical protein LCGC14_2755800 [marine sediment metagenome]|uniref:Uncharacterized protein n=1 Tax=marine sediment metagenome TaxID=412755 RepID=A0A0F8Z0A4_9ZZZZ
MKKFKPPTLEEIEAYAKEKSLLVDATFFFNYFEASDPPWHDSNGKAVRSWKQKMWTWHRMYQERGEYHTCSQSWCKKRGVYIKGADRDGHPYYWCLDHKPKPPPLPKAVEDMVRGIGDIPPEKKTEPVWKQRKRLLNEN